MLFYPPFLAIILVAVTGVLARWLLVTWLDSRRDSRPAGVPVDLEERLRKIEAATSGLIMDMSAMREKERFMTRLKAGADSRDDSTRPTTSDAGEPSPMATQNIPITRPAGHR